MTTAQDQNYTEPEDMGRDMGRINPAHLVEAFLNPGDNLPEMLMRLRLEQGDAVLMMVAIEELMEIEDEASIWTLLNMLTITTGAGGKAWDAALSSITRVQPPPERRRRGWGWSRRKTTPSEPTPGDFDEGYQ